MLFSDMFRLFLIPTYNLYNLHSAINVSERPCDPLLSLQRLNYYPLPFTSILMKFQQSRRMLMWLHQELIIKIINFPSTTSLEITILNIAGDTSIQYHKTKKCSFQIVWKLTRLPGKLSHCLKCFHIVWKLSRLSENLPGCLERFQFVCKLFI